MSSLWVPPFYSRGVGNNGLALQHNLEATPSTTPGTTVTAAGTAHVKGSWTSLLDPVGFDVCHIWVMLGGTFVAATETGVMVDIGIGPSGGGSEQVIIPNLLGGHTPTWGNLGIGRVFSSPFYIPKGTRISARAQARTASDTVEVMLFVYGGMSGQQWLPTRADDIGCDTATTRGTLITAGSTGAESAWTNVGAATGRDYHGYYFMGAGGSNTTITALAYHWETGFSSTAHAEFYTQCTTSEVVNGPWPNVPVFMPIPSGTQMQVRGECSGTAVEMSAAYSGLY
jgi:hypothetical protein